MSDRLSETSFTALPPAAQARGTIATSIVAQTTFIAVLAGVGVLAYLKVDGALPVLLTLAGVAGTNATTVINFWVGASNEASRTTHQGPTA